MAKTPPHGTAARYRLELKTKTVCDRCRSANTRAKRRQRQQAQQKRSRPLLSLVPDVQPERTNGTTDVVEPADETPRAQNGAEYHQVDPSTATVKAFLADIASISPEVPFFHTLKQAGLVIARDIDDVNHSAAKGPLLKQLLDVVRELKGKGDGDGNSFDDFLADLLKPPPVTAPPDRDT